MQQLKLLRRYEDVLQSIEKEHGGLDSRGVWELVPLPEGEKAFPVMLLIKVKLNPVNDPDGSENCVKSRAVIMGNHMTEGKDYGDTFAPCGSLTTCRAMLADVVQHRKCCKSIDVKMAFTFGKPDRPTYLKQPPGRKLARGPDGTPLVYYCHRLLYGTPSGPRRWHVEIHNALGNIGMCPSASDPCLYTKRNGGASLAVLLYVDDCLITYDDNNHGRELHAELIAMFKNRFELQDDGESDCTGFLGMQLRWAPNKSWVRISTPGIISRLLESEGLADCTPAPTPGCPKTLISDRDCPVEGPEGDSDRRIMQGRNYRSRLGALLWISRIGHPEIAFQVNSLARVAHNPGPAHWDASTRLLRYLKGAQHIALTLSKDDSGRPFHIYGYSDADWAPDYGGYADNYRSTTGWCFAVGRSLLSWRSRRQQRVAQSSAESEYYAAADAAKEACHLKRIFADIGLDATVPVRLSVDNQSAIKQAESPIDHEMSRHVDLRSHFLREQVRLRNLELQYVPTTEQWADAMTKNLPTSTFEYLRGKLGVSGTQPFTPTCAQVGKG